jgi:NAD(P)-dependent dehydrogenase (short-subunit alcohol dehydrogenase family)
MGEREDGRRALVTGATRGIGKATAIALAHSGWDVAVTGRTLREGEGRDTSDTGRGRPLPGSLESTAAAVRDLGRRSMPLVADLHDLESVRAAAAAAVGEWGGVDLVVNNAVDTGPGSMVGVLELTVEQLRTKLMSNVVAQMVTIKALLPGMLERGRGTIVDVSSHVAVADPPGPVGEGGWGLAYAASKAAFHRFAPLLAIELGDEGILAYNIDPGYVATERQQANAEALGLADRYLGAPASVPAAAIAWLADHPDAVENGATVRAQKLALERGLHPDWRERSEPTT